MKFGKYLEENLRHEWRSNYVDYKLLKDLIKESLAETERDENARLSFSPRTTSLTVQRPNRGKLNSEEEFFAKLEEQVSKVAKFTDREVSSLKKRLKALKDGVRNDKNKTNNATLMEEARLVGDEFLALEKYVNLNYLGFHKIVKKHDKMLPHAPCQQFYVAHLHHQPWVQGNHSHLLVQLSNVYSQLRGDTSGIKNEDSAQGFVRSTSKYWVRMADVSTVKHHVLQHLPVFQYNVGDDDQQDSQLVNSVYFDNSSMELYHGRLDKRPNAIALRIRWYGDGEPSLCFVERKTHREGWKGEESVKERFTLKENQIVPFMTGDLTLEEATAQLRNKGKSSEEVAKFATIFQEVQKVADSKQLNPMIRTQYMRTAFQIPFDATVRVSLDTNLAMIKENPDVGPSCAISGRWYRDPSLPIPRSEITRFPHAVLEVKLSLAEGQEAPEWVQELIDSGYLTEVHKFSKFIHGTATLLPDMVQAVPYWVDDESLRPSINQSTPQYSQPVVSSASGRMRHERESFMSRVMSLAGHKPRRRDAEEELTHPLLGDQPTLQLLTPREEVGFGRSKPGKKKAGPLDWWFNSRAPKKGEPRALARTTPMRIEPKTFFANERTFLSWLHMAVTIGSISAALLGFAGTDAKKEHQPTENLVEIIAMILLPVAVAMVAYALTVFIWRSKAIAKKQVGYIDDRFGPLGLAVVVVLALSAIFVISITDFVLQLRVSHHP